MKFNIFRNPFISQYIKAWQDGFDEGYRQAMSTNEDIGYVSLNEDRPKYEDFDKEARAQRIQRGIGKWEQDLDIAYWQGYNNAMIEKDCNAENND
jgi:hypothetical protein